MTTANGQDVATRNLPKRRKRPGIERALFNTLVTAAGFAVCVVGPAATWTWWPAWVMVGVFLIMHAVGTLRIIRLNPSLLPERARKSHEGGLRTAGLWTAS